MAGRLTARAVDSLKGEGRYLDGDGLYLHVRETGAKQWLLRITSEGKRRDIGLGSLATGITLAMARERAAKARLDKANGIDPLAAKKAAIVKPTFGVYALGLIETIESEFRNEKHRAQWRSTLTIYAKAIWATRIDRVDEAGVLACLRPIWQVKPETASRVRGRIERVLDAARAEGLRAGENPARWRGHLNAVLPKPGKLTRGHHAALAYADMPAFIADLRKREGVVAVALELAILTACRTSEVIAAQWREINLDAGVWIIPACRMKAAREHRVALSSSAVAILTPLAAARTSDFVFPGGRGGDHLSTMAMAVLLRRIRPDVTVHGFRSTFSDWASEVSSFSAELRETALAHTIGNKAEAAYRRGDALEKRRAMMEAWAVYCEPKCPSENSLSLWNHL